MRDDLNNSSDEENAEASSVPVGRKYTRKQIILYSFVGFLCLLAIIGLIISFTGKAVDPTSVKAPIYTKQMIEEQDKLYSTPIPTQTIAPVEPPVVEIINPEEKGVPQDSPVEQKEVPLKLTPQKPLTNEPVNTIEEPVAPQSMIIWDEPKKVAAPVIAPIAPVFPKGKAPQIAIVIDDMGLNMRNSREMAQMKYTTTLAYMPYAQHLPQQTKAAYDNGHELIVHMPMEPQDIAHNNPGPDALLTTLSPQENEARLQRNLSKFEGFIGLNNHMGSRITANEKVMRPIMQTIKDKGLWFLDSRTIGNSVAGKLAAELRIPYVTRDIFLDNVETVPAVLAQLKQLEVLAKKHGYAVAIGHPYNCTVAALKQWMPEAQRQGFVLVPLSTIIAQRFPDAKVPRYAQTKRTAAKTADIVAANQ